MKIFKIYLLAVIVGLGVFCGCNSGNDNKNEDNQLPDTSAVSDSPQVQQPNGYAPSNAKGQADSMDATDSLH